MKIRILNEKFVVLTYDNFLTDKLAFYKYSNSLANWMNGVFNSSNTLEKLEQLRQIVPHLENEIKETKNLVETKVREIQRKIQDNLPKSLHILQFSFDAQKNEAFAVISAIHQPTIVVDPETGHCKFSNFEFSQDQADSVESFFKLPIWDELAYWIDFPYNRTYNKWKRQLKQIYFNAITIRHKTQYYDHIWQDIFIYFKPKSSQIVYLLIVDPDDNGGTAMLYEAPGFDGVLWDAQPLRSDINLLNLSNIREITDKE